MCEIPSGWRSSGKCARQHDNGCSCRRVSEVLFDHFAGQIFADIRQATRQVLVRAALLPSITAEQAYTLCNDALAGALLEHLYRRRLFVDRCGDAYKVHDLFRAFLLRERDTSLIRRTRS